MSHAYDSSSRGSAGNQHQHADRTAPCGVYIQSIGASILVSTARANREFIARPINSSLPTPRQI